MGSITPYETGSGRRYRVRYRLPNRSQTDKRGFRTKREAELFLASVEVSKARGEFVAASQSRILLAEWAETWLANQVQLKPSTRAGYESIMRHAILPRWGNVPLAGLTHADIQNWLTEVSTKLSAGTTRSYHRVMSMILKYAVRDGRLSRNPADGVKLPRASSATVAATSRTSRCTSSPASRSGTAPSSSSLPTPDSGGARWRRCGSWTSTCFADASTLIRRSQRSVASWSTGRRRTTAGGVCRSRPSSRNRSQNSASAKGPSISCSRHRWAVRFAIGTGELGPSTRR